MFSIFSYQPELFLSPNFIFSPILFSRSAVLVIGATISILIFIYTIYILYIKNTSFSFSLFWRGIMIAWLPLFINFIYGGIIDLQKAIKLSTVNKNSKAQDRYCQIDKAQNLGGLYCALPTMINEVYTEIPLGAHIFLLNGMVRPFFEYQLASDYYITDSSDRVDYMIVYFPNSPLYSDTQIDNKPIFKFTDNQQHITQFILKKRINSEIMILQRLNS